MDIKLGIKARHVSLVDDKFASPLVSKNLYTELGSLWGLHFWVIILNGTVQSDWF